VQGNECKAASAGQRVRGSECRAASAVSAASHDRAEERKSTASIAWDLRVQAHLLEVGACAEDICQQLKINPPLLPVPMNHHQRKM